MSGADVTCSGGGCGYKTFSDCCRRCKDCPHCYDMSLSYLSDVLYRIKVAVGEYSCSYINRAYYGYGGYSSFAAGTDLSPSVSKEAYRRLLHYRGTLLRVYDAILRGYQPCLCPEEVQDVYERVSELVDKPSCPVEDRCDLHIDTAHYADWVLRNPYCVAYEDWEAAFVKRCPRVIVEVYPTVNPPLLTYTLSVIDRSNEVCRVEVFDVVKNVSCDIEVLDEVTVKDCEIRVNGKVRTRECRMQYDALVRSRNCRFGFSTYVKLLSCNLSYDTISKLLSCGIDLDYNVVNRSCDLILGPKTRVALCDVNINDLIEI